MDTHEPSYVALHKAGELARRAEELVAALGSCELCPRTCGLNRLNDETGFCRSGRRAQVSSFGPHFGEEAPLVGHGGSGTIFLTNCNLGCIFCQNYDISHLAQGAKVPAERMADMMLALQRRGCHNINFVTPTHFVPQILEALHLAVGGGLRVPLVYNCGGYESLDTLKLLDGVFDIYMPDAKYASSEVAAQLSDAPDYPERMQESIGEMHGQVGDLELDDQGIAVRGLLVRHLVLPEGLAGTKQTMEFLASLSANTYVNVMAQYRPCHRAGEVETIARRITTSELQDAVQMALDAGLTRLDDRRARLLFI
jgi:putative pyruvate formate lyase activating enzyme